MDYRVILKDDGIEIGSMGFSAGGITEHWVRGIDNVIPMREIDARGIGKESMRQFRAAWDQFSANPVRLTEFLQAKRNRLGEVHPTRARRCSPIKERSSDRE